VFEGSVSDLSEVMNQMFMAELNFDQIYTTLKQETLVSHGWPAMAAALLVSSSDGAIIGDQVQGYSQRLVQTFIGLPWISTQSRASAMHKILEKKIKDQKANDADSGSASALKELQRQLEAMPDISSAENQRKKDHKLLQELDSEALKMQIALNELELNLQKTKSERETLSAEWLKLKRTLQAKQEEASAGLIFRKLQPVCCPSCESTQFKNIQISTSDDSTCPLCKDTKTTEDNAVYETDPNLVKEIDEAGEKLSELDLEMSKQRDDLAELKKKIEGVEGNRDEVKSRVEKTTDLSEQLTKRTALEIAINELSEAVSKTPSKIDTAESETLDILSKTFDVTKKCSRNVKRRFSKKPLIHSKKLPLN
jgi:DNA repair exonuclease SbcCD ATPase subunit